MSELTIAAVPITLLDHMLPKSISHIEKVINKAPLDLSLDSLKKDLYSGTSMLITISDKDEVIAVNIVSADEMPTGHRVLWIPVTGGDRMDEWLERFLSLAHQIARDLNCQELRGIPCRTGWMRILKKQNWYPIHEIIGCKVESEVE